MTNEEYKKLEEKLDKLEVELSNAVQSGDEAAGRIGCEAYAVSCQLREADMDETELAALADFTFPRGVKVEKKCCSVCHRPMSDEERVCDRCAGVAPPSGSELKAYFAAVRELYAAHDAEIEEFGVYAAEV